MRVLSYSPSVEAYVAASDGYYDLSPDIIRCNVSRQENGTSTFSLTLQNKNGKYNGRFMPMDRITIYATKRDKRQQLLTGYISTVTGYTLYPQDFSISGFCSLYQLQKTWWDSGLVKSQQLLQRTDWYDSQDAGMSSLVRRLITVIGGWNPSNVIIDEGVPHGILEWARELYNAKQTDYEYLKGSVEEFYAMLSGSTGTLSTYQRVPITGSSSYSDATASATQKFVASNAEGNNGTEPCTSGYCAAWVSGIYNASGLGYPGGNAIDFWDWWGDEAHYQDMNAPLGSVVVGSGWPYGGSPTHNPYGHVGIVISGGRVADNVGYHRITDSVEAWASSQHANCNGRFGYVGWVWPNRRDLSKA